ncbi:cell filamentation protein Fic [Dolosicoccus paucivorans]|uniref:Cell filamentation protein Fic n=1 Tax=Dolosicoccus paucivorans TaxID=84521 RepID=A0A2N6SPN6_9LACT|nr:virulence RhuM family protein [Dolosicoccus paucivorans]PMB85026.1 cell filamentation protein Fic [Dolosicoccus paucivorans]PMC59019.1 cell filamentation protein Fic [Dolosicoccus paucivorans]
MELKQSKFIMYETDDHEVIADVLVKDETLWMTQKQMAALFDIGIPAISKHLSNIFNEGELLKDSVVSKMEITAQDNKNYMTSFYNLDAIISVGYRVNSKKATNFRQWATSVLKEYMIKGFAMDDERLKQGSTLLGQDYFQELLERVRSIRASKRHIWQKITDIFAEVSTDYDKDSPTTRYFYATIQNKFHYGITGQTAAELIYNKADRNEKNMGLTTWKHAPDGRILKSNTKVAKNYLTENEIKALERNISAYFDYIEGLIERRQTFTTQEFAASVDRFLTFNEYEILEGHGNISMKVAQEKAFAEYDEFNKNQTIVSDFDQHIQKMLDEFN